MIDPTTMTSTEICNVITTPCRRRGSSWNIFVIGPPPSDRPPNTPFEEAEQGGNGVSGDQVENAGGRPCLNVLEGIGHHFAGNEGQFRYGDGHSKRSVLEERDECIAERREDGPKHDRQGDVAGNLHTAQSKGAACLQEAAADIENARAEHLSQIG